MSRISRFFLIAMSVAFAICIFGLLTGMFYYLYAVVAHHQTLESVLGKSIVYYKTLAALGIVGMLCFFAFLLSLMSKNNSDRPR